MSPLRRPTTRSRGRSGACGWPAAGSGSCRSARRATSPGPAPGSRCCAKGSRRSPTARPPGGLAWAPLGGSFEDVESGYVIAPYDAASWAPADAGVGRGSGTVEAIAIAAAAEAPMALVESATARAGRGLDGDRYFDGEGTFSNPHSRGHDLTLIEAEVVDELGVAPEVPRRNVVTRGIDLNALVGHRFRVGEVECEGQRLCEPCAHLQRLTEPRCCGSWSTAAGCARRRLGRRHPRGTRSSRDVDAVTAAPRLGPRRRARGAAHGRHGPGRCRGRDRGRTRRSGRPG